MDVLGQQGDHRLLGEEGEAVGGQPLASTPIYALPVSVALPIAFTAAPGVGITDTLNLSTSKITVSKDGAAIARLLLNSTDALDYTASLSVTATGTYTFAFDGHTNAGAALSTTVTVPVALNTITLLADPPVQDGANVSVTTYTAGTVDGVLYKDSDIVLRIGDMEVPLGNLAEVESI
jgi:hypothetical protein